MPGRIWLAGTAHRIVGMNDRYAGLIGRDIVGRTMYDVFTHPEAVAAFPFVDRVAETGDPIVMRMRLPKELSDHGTNPMGVFSLEVTQRYGQRVVEARWKSDEVIALTPAHHESDQDEERRTRVARWTLGALVRLGPAVLAASLALPSL